MATRKPKQAVQQVVAIAEHTPGPWHWDLRPGMRSVSLMARGFTVMDFARWGMDNAAPRFRTERCLMVRVEELGAPIPGREHHEWAKQIIHPDARLIAAAPDLLAACETVDAVLTAENRETANNLLQRVRVVIAWATGKAVAK
jgi:hypothetical protein